MLALWGTVPGSGDFSENTLLADRAVDIASVVGAKRVLHCSSSAVYGPSMRAEENSAVAPMNAYGVAKIEMEQRLINRNKGVGAPFSIAMRLANTVGADSLFGAMKSGQPVTLDSIAVGESPIRSYATPTVIWRAVTALLACQTPPEIINVATAKPVPMHGLLDAARYPYVWRPAPESAVGEVSLDVTLWQRITGETGLVSPADMIAEWRLLQEGTI